MLIINPEFDRYRYYNFISNSINKIVEKDQKYVVIRLIVFIITYQVIFL